MTHCRVVFFPMRSSVFGYALGPVADFNRECVRNARPQGNFEPPEESSNGLRYREPPLPPSHLSGSESGVSSVIPNRTPLYETFG
jgi:hypothetical protein